MFKHMQQPDQTDKLSFTFVHKSMQKTFILVATLTDGRAPREANIKKHKNVAIIDYAARLLWRFSSDRGRARSGRDLGENVQTF